MRLRFLIAFIFLLVSQASAGWLPLVKSSGGGGTVAFDASTGTTAATGTGTSLSYSFTVGASANAQELHFWVDNNAVIPTGLACAWDFAGTNQSMTVIPNTTTASNGGLTGASANFGLLAPTTGAKTGRCTWTGSFTAHISAESFTGVNQGSIAAAFPNGNTVSQSSAVASPVSITITSATNHLVVSSFAQAASVWGTISGTTMVNDTVGPSLAIASNRTAGATSVTATAAYTGTSPQIASGNDVSP